MRIYYLLNRKEDGKITWRDFKNSNLFQAMLFLDKEDDINKVNKQYKFTINLIRLFEIIY